MLARSRWNRGKSQFVTPPGRAGPRHRHALVVTGQRLEPKRAFLACRVVEPDRWCRRCGCVGVPRDSVVRELAHEPFGWRQTTLLVTVRRYRCTGLRARMAPRHDQGRRASGTTVASWVAVGTGGDRPGALHRVARVAEGLGVGWGTWVEALGMPGAQVAAVDYAPAGWPEDACSIVRRVRVDAMAISADPRSRRRRTIDKDQLALALEGTATHAYAVSFIVTNIPADDRPGDTSGNAESIAEVEAWFRRRTDIEDRIREAKLGAALRKLPSGSATRRSIPCGCGLRSRREPLGPAASRHRPRQGWPCPCRAATARPALRPGPPDPARPDPHAAAAARRPTVAARAPRFRDLDTSGGTASYLLDETSEGRSRDYRWFSARREGPGTNSAPCLVAVQKSQGW